MAAQPLDRHVRFLAAGDMLAGPMPAPDLFRSGRVGHVEDHADVAFIALRRGGDVGVTVIHGEPVDTVAGGLPEMDVFGVQWIGHVENVEPAREPGFGLARIVDGFVIGEHQVAHDSHLVRMAALMLAVEGLDHLRILGVGHIDDGGRFPAEGVTDVSGGSAEGDLAAALDVDPADLANS